MVSQKKTGFYGLKSAGQVSNTLTQKIISKKDHLLGSLLHDWDLIVGKDHASTIRLNKLSFPKGKNKEGTLHLSVTTGSVAMMANYLQPLILDKVNQFAGYKAFEKITLSHMVMAPLTPFKKSKNKYVLKDEEEMSINALLTETPEGDLKEALKALGQSLYATKESS